jgi:hypothetical protein
MAYPESGAKQKPSNDQDPDGCLGFGVDDSGLVGSVGGRPGADGVGDVVGTVGD